MTYLNIDSLGKFVDHSVANVTSDFISIGHLKQEAPRSICRTEWAPDRGRQIHSILRQATVSNVCTRAENVLDA